MERKSDAVRRFVAGRDYKSALRIAKNFRIGLDSETRRQFSLAYECIVHPVFYKALGKDLEDEIRKGIEMLIKIYGGDT